MIKYKLNKKGCITHDQYKNSGTKIKRTLAEHQLPSEHSRTLQFLPSAKDTRRK